MNVRQQKYKKNIIEGMSKYAAARKAGYSHNTACAAKNLEKLIDMDTLLEFEGLTDRKLAEHIAEGLVACDEVKVGTIDVSKPLWQVRHKYLETILKLKKLLQDKTVIDNSQHTYLTLIKEAIERAQGFDTNGREIVKSSIRES